MRFKFYSFSSLNYYQTQLKKKKHIDKILITKLYTVNIEI